MSVFKLSYTTYRVNRFESVNLLCELIMGDNEVMKKLEEIQRTIVSSKEEVLKELNGKISKLEEKMEKDMDGLRYENEQLKTKIDELEQYSMKNDAIVCGISDKKNETEDNIIKGSQNLKIAYTFFKKNIKN